MSRILLTVLALVGLVGLGLLMAGCPRQVEPPPPPVSPMLPSSGPAPGETTLTPTVPSGELGEMVQAHAKVASYNVVVTIDGKQAMEAAVKAEGGKPTAVRATTRSGYVLVLPGEQTQYLLDKTRKTATRQALGKVGEGYLGKLPSPMAMAAKNPTVATEKLEGVDCWRLEWSNERGEKVQVWVDKKHGLAQKAIHGAVVTLYKYDKIGQVPQEVFTVPADYQEKELSTAAPVPVPSTRVAPSAPPAAAPPPPAQPPPPATGTAAPTAGLTPAP